MYRRDHTLTGRSPLRGDIAHPSIRWSFPLGGSENECFPFPPQTDGWISSSRTAGCCLRTDGSGAIVWKSRSYGVNAVGAVEDLDGDGRLEIVCCTGYLVIVLAAIRRASDEALCRLPPSAGTQASTLLATALTGNPGACT